MKKSVFGLAKTQDQARRIVDRLQNEGFDVEYISVLVYDKDNKLTRVNAEGDLETNPDLIRAGTRQKAANKGTTTKGTIGTEKSTKLPEGAAAGATAGGIIGGSLGLLAGLGAIAIPGFGAFIAAGPILAALSGSGLGGGLGLLLGALTGLGIPEYEVKKYADRLKQGKILISIEVPNTESIDTAKNILKQEGAEDISTVSETSKAR